MLNRNYVFKAFNLLFAFLLTIGLFASAFLSANAFSQRTDLRLAANREEMVYFNTNSLKYHRPNCEWAVRCTRNCISIPLPEAIRRGGIPCKVCGG